MTDSASCVTDDTSKMSSAVSAFSSASASGLFGKGLFKRQPAAAVVKSDAATEDGTHIVDEPVLIVT